MKVRPRLTSSPVWDKARVISENNQHNGLRITFQLSKLVFGSHGMVSLLTGLCVFKSASSVDPLAHFPPLTSLKKLMRPAYFQELVLPLTNWTTGVLYLLILFNYLFARILYRSCKYNLMQNML